MPASLQRHALVLHADEAPMPGVACPGTHQTYRHPRLSVASRPLGELGANDIRIEMLYAGICGTDLHFAEADPQTGYIRTSCPASVPSEGRVPGHEGVGRVIATGSGVSHLRKGMIVALESIIICGTCDCCRSGQPNQCRTSRLLGMEQDGLFSTAADVPASLAHDVSSLAAHDAGLRALACMEPAAVAWEACRNARVRENDRIVVFGGGPIGLYCAMLARAAYGSGPVHIVEPSPFRRQLASRWADEAVTPETFFASPGDAIDVVFEASGDLSHVDSLFPHMNAAGRIVLLGRSGKPLVLDGTDHLITKNLSLLGSRGHLGGAFGAVLDLHRRGLFQPGDIVTRIVDGLDALREILADPARVARQDAKILVRFPENLS